MSYSNLLLHDGKIYQHGMIMYMCGKFVSASKSIRKLTGAHMRLFTFSFSNMMKMKNEIWMLYKSLSKIHREHGILNLINANTFIWILHVIAFRIVSSTSICLTVDIWFKCNKFVRICVHSDCDSEKCFFYKAPARCWYSCVLAKALSLLFCAISTVRVLRTDEKNNKERWITKKKGKSIGKLKRFVGRFDRFQFEWTTFFFHSFYLFIVEIESSARKCKPQYVSQIALGFS